MRILSKKNDYFDYLSKVYDPSQSSPTVFDRNLEIELPLFNLKKISNDLYEYIDGLSKKYVSGRRSPQWNGKFEYTQMYYFAFGGYLYPFLKVSEGYKNGVSETVHYLVSSEEVLEKCGELDLRPWYYYSNGGEVSSKDFDPIELPDEMRKMHMASTVCQYSKNSGYNLQGETDAYSYLADYGFSRVIPPEQAYQILSMYVADLNNIEKEYIAPDLEKVGAHGFDKKVSFRSNHPGKQK